MGERALMATDNGRFWATEEWSFAILRALSMLGGMIALLLVPLRPEHQPHLFPLAWAFVVYKVFLFLAIWAWPARLRVILLSTVGLDLLFVSLFVWFSGGLESHFYVLFYLLVALAAAYFGPALGLATAGGAGVLYSLVSVVGTPGAEWHNLSPRIATLFLLGGSLGYISQRERLARAEAERLNAELQANQVRLKNAYQDLQAAQDRLMQSERLAAIGQMAAKVSHEVRNPLSSISLNAELLEDELQALPEDRRAEAASLLAAIRSQVDVLSTVTEEYLRFARLPKPKFETTALRSVIEELAEFVQGDLQARGVQLFVPIPEGLPTLRLDPGQIRQALLNLVRNAVEAMPDGGTIHIAARRVKLSSGQLVDTPPPIDDSTTRPIAKGDFIEVAVRDTGTGIPPENLDRIFEPFFTSKEGGTGLGLAIARQIAADHGGSLTCESAHGRGTIFRLILPISDGGRNV
jgi:signal transduction histidine kinase